MMKSYNSIELLNKDFIFYSKRFAGLEQLSSYGPGKIGLHNNETYISWYYLQGLQRYYYGENRYILLSFLKENINSYVKYYYILKELCTLNKTPELLKLIKQNNDLLQKWKKGLEYLKIAYNKTKMETAILSLLGDLAINQLNSN